MKTPFREAHGSYGFATWDQRPSYEEALWFLRGLARTGDGRRNLRRLYWELTADPELSSLGDDDLLETLSRQLASGALRVWETPRVVPDRSLEQPVEEAPAEWTAPTAPSAAVAASSPAVSLQAAALRMAAEEGLPFCEL